MMFTNMGQPRFIPRIKTKQGPISMVPGTPLWKAVKWREAVIQRMILRFKCQRSQGRAQ